MNELYDNSPQVERALLVGLESDRIEAREAASLLRELSGLASSLGVEPVTTMMVKLREKTANLLLGSGKADEIAAAAKAEGVDSIIFDHPLSPIQQRNWEKLTGLKVYDRAELIIKIFSARALTREAGLQVELARLNTPSRGWPILTKNSPVSGEDGMAPRLGGAENRIGPKVHRAQDSRAEGRTQGSAQVQGCAA